MINGLCTLRPFMEKTAMSNNKSRNFKTKYCLVIEGRSKFFEGDNDTFAESFFERWIEQCINQAVILYKDKFTKTKVEIKKEKYE